MKLDIPYVINDQVMTTKEYWSQFYTGFQLKLAVITSRKVWQRCRLAGSQNWRCCWCGDVMVPQPGFKNSVTREHIVPKSQGGSNDDDNIAAACYVCNGLRGVMPVEEFMERVAAAKALYDARKTRREEAKNSESPWNRPAAIKAQLGRQHDIEVQKAAAANRAAMVAEMRSFLKPIGRLGNLLDERIWPRGTPAKDWDNDIILRLVTVLDANPFAKGSKWEIMFTRYQTRYLENKPFHSKRNTLDQCLMSSYTAVSNEGVHAHG